jgi:hypothetical protein
MIKKTVLQIIITVFTVLIAVNPLWCLVYANDIVNAFPEPSRKDIEQSNVAGAVNFLRGMGQACLLLAEYEQSSQGATMNVKLAYDYAKAAQELFSQSRIFFQKGLDAASKAGYDTERVAVMKSIAFTEILSGQNQTATDKVKGFYIKGDILGIYKENISNIGKIQETLGVIIQELTLGVNTQKTGNYWQLYQRLAEASLFGNLSTVVGKSAF